MPPNRFQNTNEIPLPLYGFMERLKGAGFTVGIDHYLRLVKLLKQIGPDAGLLRLKYLLCPLFAVSSKQQNQFYRLFDQHFKKCLTDIETRAAPVQKERAVKAKGRFKSVYKWPYALAAAVIFISIVLGTAYYINWKNAQKTPAITEPVPRKSKEIGGLRKENLRITIDIKAEPTPVTFSQRYGPGLYFSLLAAPLIIWLFYELYLTQKKEAAISRQKGRKPPYYWPIRVASPSTGFLKDKPYYDAIRYFRQRQKSDLKRLDLEKTLSDTIEKAGFPKLCYRLLTKPPEYLLLIDQPEKNDHYAAFLNTLYYAFKNEGVFIERYFYSYDPLVCFKYPQGQRVYLTDLAVEMPEHRLILAGSAGALLHPVSGELDNWSKLFKTWKERAILTPKAPYQWGMQEVMLAREFIVLPATLNGFSALIDYFDPPSKPDFKTWVCSEKENIEYRLEKLARVEFLKKALSPTVFNWLCICAVYPELNWSLTLHLAGFLKQPVTEKDLLTLIRLPWFKEGVLPEELRLKLTAELDQNTFIQVRKAILKVLENDPPPKESRAWDFYRLNLAVYKGMIRKNRRRYLKKIKENLNNLAGGDLHRDHLLLRLLEAGPKPLAAFILPKRFCRLFFKRGLFLLGLKTGVRAGMVLLFSLLLFIIAPKPNADVSRRMNRLTMEFAHIPAGTFTMGSPNDELDRDKDEVLHKVTLSKDFYMQTTEVTQGQWRAVMGENPSYFKNCGDDCPVESVSWDDAVGFIKQLNKIQDQYIFRLPTEAQWEYAARAGTATPFSFGETLDTNQANYDGDYPYGQGAKGIYRKKTTPVKNFSPNAWGLYDMHGNVWEWCRDWYGDYSSGGVTDPQGPSSGDYRVLRGGSWVIVAGGCRSANRYRGDPGYRYSSRGFRLAVSLVSR